METTPEVTEPPVQAGPDHAHDAHHHAHPEEDPSNPHYFGLPLGVIIAASISAIAVSITLIKFFYFS